MKLNLAERYMLLYLLPEREDISVLRIARDLKTALSPSEKEYKEFEIRDEGGMILWNAKGNKEKEIPIGEKATAICAKALKDANAAKKLTETHISLYDKFVEE